MRAGLCIKPGTPIEPMIEVLKANPGITLALIMTVEPGFGGQKFMSAMMPKVRELRRHFPTLDVQVDGGLDSVTVVEAAEAGANVIVAGTSIFKAKEGPSAAIAQLRGVVSKALGGSP
jgi:ribulose-phosphate 3-epimerase